MSLASLSAAKLACPLPDSLQAITLMSASGMLTLFSICMIIDSHLWRLCCLTLQIVGLFFFLHNVIKGYSRAQSLLTSV